MTIEACLGRLLERLESLTADHEELFDSECRERMGLSIMNGFVRGQGTQAVAADLGLSTDEANRVAQAALAEFVIEAHRIANARALTFKDRLNAFQNDAVVTNRGNDYEEFFGHTPPEFYDNRGNVVRTR